MSSKACHDGFGLVPFVVFNGFCFGFRQAFFIWALEASPDFCRLFVTGFGVAGSAPGLWVHGPGLWGFRVSGFGGVRGACNAWTQKSGPSGLLVFFSQGLGFRV